MGKMTTFIQDIAKEVNIEKSGYRVITNIGDNSAQEVKTSIFSSLRWS